MKVGILADQIGTQAGGLETYERELIKGCMQSDFTSEYVIYCSSNRAKANFRHHQGNFSFVPISPSSKIFRLSLALPYELSKNYLDFLHACMVPPLLCPRPTHTVHDLAPFSNPKLFPWNIRLRGLFLLSLGIKKATKLIAVSETTKIDLIRIFRLNASDIEVIHLGIDAQYQSVQDEDKINRVLQKYGI